MKLLSRCQGPLARLSISFLHRRYEFSLSQMNSLLDLAENGLQTPRNSENSSCIRKASKRLRDLSPDSEDNIQTARKRQCREGYSIGEELHKLNRKILAIEQRRSEFERQFLEEFRRFNSTQEEILDILVQRL